MLQRYFLIIETNSLKTKRLKSTYCIMAATYENTAYTKFFDNLNLFERKHAPKELFVTGNVSLLTTGKRVSVVGSRKASSAGLNRARSLTRKLVEQGIIVVSGLAEGIDTMAHQTAIEEGGKTIAVLGTPLNKPYPAKNKELLEVIKRDHLAISQFPEGYPFDRTSFPRRNRTMALISDATVIVEASENSGTRHQGWEALRLGRKVFILASVFDTPGIIWPHEMLDYGAEVLSSDHHLQEVLIDIPQYTSEELVEF